MTTVAGTTYHPRNSALWAGVLLSPIAWAAQLQVVYVLADQACKGNVQELVMRITTAVFFVLAVLGGVIGAIEWRRARSQDSAEDSPEWKRSRWMAVEAMLSGGLFAVVIVAQWLSVVSLKPCPAS